MTKAERLKRDERMALCRELPLIRDRLFRCGLIHTSQAMDTAVKRIGYEAADLLTTPKEPKP